MSKGLDANTILTPHARCIAEAGYRWVARYIKKTHSALTHGEAQALSAAGLYVVSVVEIGSPTDAAHFSLARGVADGEFAYTYARDHLKQPAGSCIYLTCDYDATLADLKGPVADYLDGVLKAFNTCSGGQPDYAIGIYGSGLCCSTLLKSTAATYSWLAMSRGYRGSRTFNGWSIRQTTGGTVCGVSVDFDESNGHAGGWKL